MDATGKRTHQSSVRQRWGDARADRDYAGSYKVADLSMGFHIVSVEWDEEKIVWTVDGMEHFHSFDGVPHQPMYLTVSLGVGTEKAGETGCADPVPRRAGLSIMFAFSERP